MEDPIAPNAPEIAAVIEDGFFHALEQNTQWWYNQPITPASSGGNADANALDSIRRAMLDDLRRPYRPSNIYVNENTYARLGALLNEQEAQSRMNNTINLQHERMIPYKTKARLRNGAEGRFLAAVNISLDFASDQTQYLFFIEPLEEIRSYTAVGSSASGAHLDIVKIIQPWTPAVGDIVRIFGYGRTIDNESMGFEGYEEYAIANLEEDFAEIRFDGQPVKLHLRNLKFVRRPRART